MAYFAWQFLPWNIWPQFCWPPTPFWTLSCWHKRSRVWVRIWLHAPSQTPAPLQSQSFKHWPSFRQAWLCWQSLTATPSCTHEAPQFAFPCLVWLWVWRTPPFWIKGEAATRGTRRTSPNMMVTTRIAFLFILFHLQLFLKNSMVSVWYRSWLKRNVSKNWNRFNKAFFRSSFT